MVELENVDPSFDFLILRRSSFPCQRLHSNHLTDQLAVSISVVVEQYRDGLRLIVVSPTTLSWIRCCVNTSHEQQYKLGTQSTEHSTEHKAQARRYTISKKNGWLAVSGFGSEGTVVTKTKSSFPPFLTNFRIRTSQKHNILKF